MTDQKKYRLHFIGIGGIGMSGIAEIFLRQGHLVSGSDLQSSEQTDRLIANGAKVFIGHTASNVTSGIQTVVVSSAVKSDNPEYAEAKRLKIPVVPRAEILAEILRGKKGITIAGTHGKTTTTSMVAQVLMQAELDPTVVVGGKVEAMGSNAKYGQGNTVVAEADESDGSFLLLPATYTVVTNIDFDHMEYYRTQERLDEAFVQFIKNIPFYGCAWLCGDDAGVRRILPELSKPYQTYGFESKNDLAATGVKTDGRIQSASLFYYGKPLGDVVLNVLGRHNLLNAMAAVGIGLSLEIPFETIRAGLAQFRHVRRRFDERYYDAARGIRVIDDYGHHPTEIKAVLQTARDTRAKRVVTVFQPHRYSRTQLCWREFLSCFEQTDVLLMVPVYSAGEEAIEGVTTTALLREIKKLYPSKNEVYLEVASLDAAQDWVAKNKQEGDLILTLGAGSITKLAQKLAQKLATK
ncbi:MAG: UDP-N-acetylmuramate--L-alanine ligase [Bdellovibrionales bacterium]|nr:UDP-N-acetylmuramate--L-alanine ligase [Bdellovibrionales bacterium]